MNTLCNEADEVYVCVGTSRWVLVPALFDVLWPPPPPYFSVDRRRSLYRYLRYNEEYQTKGEEGRKERLVAWGIQVQGELAYRVHCCGNRERNLEGDRLTCFCFVLHPPTRHSRYLGTRIATPK